MLRMLTAGLVVTALAAPALAEDEPKPKPAAPSAASLIGKKLSTDQQSATAERAPKAKTGAWTYGLDYDDPGLERTADASERGGRASLSVAHPYIRRCDRAAPPIFGFGGDERFPLKGDAGSRTADAWLFLAKGEAFDAAGRKARLDFSENDGALHLRLDPAELSAARSLAICPIAKAPGAGKTSCAIFDLEGFARAFDFVCEAK
jgi:hypothetical protein